MEGRLYFAWGLLCNAPFNDTCRHNLDKYVDDVDRVCAVALHFDKIDVKFWECILAAAAHIKNHYPRKNSMNSLFIYIIKFKSSPHSWCGADHQICTLCIQAYQKYSSNMKSHQGVTSCTSTTFKTNVGICVHRKWVFVIEAVHLFCLFTHLWFIFHIFVYLNKCI